MNEQVLKDLVATAQKYNYNWSVIIPKFPELKNYNSQLLKDYVATAEKYNYNYKTVNQKFPEFKIQNVAATTNQTQQPKKKSTVSPSASGNQKSSSGLGSAVSQAVKSSAVRPDGTYTYPGRAEAKYKKTRGSWYIDPDGKGNYYQIKEQSRINTLEKSAVSTKQKPSSLGQVAVQSAKSAAPSATPKKGETYVSKEITRQATEMATEFAKRTIGAEPKETKKSDKYASLKTFVGLPGKESVQFKLDTSGAYPVWKVGVKSYDADTALSDLGIKQYDPAAAIKGKTDKEFIAGYQDVNDPKLVAKLNAHFKQNASTSPVENVFTGFPGKDAEYRVRDGFWEKRPAGNKEFYRVYNEGSINALNKQFGQNIKYSAGLDKFSGVAEDVELLKKKTLDKNISSINSDLIAKEEDEVIKTLKAKFPNFTFRRSARSIFEGDAIEVFSPNKKDSIYIDLDNWTDDTNNEQARSLRGFIKTHSNEELVNSIESLRSAKEANEIQEGVNVYNRKAQPGDPEYDINKPTDQQPLVFRFKTVTKEEKDLANQKEQLARKEYAKQSHLIYRDIYDKQKQAAKTGSTYDDKEIQAQVAAIPHDKELISQSAKFTDDINKMYKDYDRKSKLLNAYAMDVQSQIKRGELSEQEYKEKYEPQIRQLNDELLSIGSELKDQTPYIQGVSKTVEEAIANEYLRKEAQGSFGEALTYKFLKGVTALPRLLAPDFGKKEQEELIRFIVGDYTTEEYMTSKNRGDLGSVVLSLAESLGTLAFGAGLGTAAGAGAKAASTIETAAFFAPSYLEMRDDLDTLTQNGANISEFNKVMMSGAYGLLSSVLEKFGMDYALQRTGVGKTVINNIMATTFKNVPKNASKEYIQAAMTSSTKALLKTVPLQVLSSAAVEGTTEGLQALSKLGIQEVYDGMSGSEYFNNKSAWEIFTDLAHEAYLGALGGGIMSSVASAPQVISTGVRNMANKEQLEVLINSASLENMDQAILTNLKSSILTGKYTKEGAKQIYGSFQEIQNHVRSMPENFTTDQKSVALDLMIERSMLEKQIENKDQSLTTPQRNRISEINVELSKLAENAVQKQTTSEVPIQPESQVSGEVAQGVPQTEPQVTTQEGEQAVQEEVRPIQETAKQAKEEVESYIVDRFRNLKLEPVIDPLLNKMNNAEYIDDADIDNALEVIFKELDDIDNSEYSDNVKNNVKDSLLNLAEKLDNYEFRTKDKTVTVAQKRAADSTRENVQKVKVEEFFSGAKAIHNGEEVEFDTTKGVVEAKLPNGNTIVFDTPSMQVKEDGIVIGDDGNLSTVTMVDRFGSEFTFDGDIALDLAIKDRQNKIGEIPPPVFDIVMEEMTVKEPYIKERTVQPQPTAQPTEAVEPTAVEPTAVEPTAAAAPIASTDNGILASPVSDKVVFVDVDGVLSPMGSEAQDNTLDDGYADFDRAAVDRLNRIVEETGADIVISSSWRRGDVNAMRDVFVKRGFKYPEKIVGETSPANDPLNRGGEIESWIAEFAPNSAFVALDDIPGAFSEQQRQNLVQTDMYQGITDDTVTDVVSRLGGKAKEKAAPKKAAPKKETEEKPAEPKATKPKKVKTEEEQKKIDEEVAFLEQLLTSEPTKGKKKIVDQKTIDENISKARKSISKILPNVGFIVHDTDESYRNATGETDKKVESSAGTYIYGDDVLEPRIHINRTKANERTAAHEVFHAVLLNSVKTDKEAQRLAKSMINAVIKSLNNVDGGQDIQNYLNDFASNYETNLQNEEKLSELLGILSSEYKTLPVPTRNIIQRFLDRIAKLVGIKPMTDIEVIDFMNTISDAISKGKELTTKDVSLLKTKGAFSRKQQPSQNINQIVALARQNNISDAAIEQYLQKQGFSDKDIVEAITGQQPAPNIDVDEIYKRSEEALKKRYDENLFIRTYKYFNKIMFDRQEGIKRLIKNIKNPTSKRAYDLLVNKPGASGWASYRFKRLERVIYKGLDSKELKYLDKLIYARRIIDINANRRAEGKEIYTGIDDYNEANARLDLLDIKNKVGEKKYEDLNSRAEVYFSAYRSQLKDLYEAGRINEATYLKFKDNEYSPIKTIKYLIGPTTNPNEVDLEASKMGISRHDINKLSNSNKNAIIMDSRWLLMLTMHANTSRSAENKMLNAFDKAIKEATQEEKAALSKSIIENPVVGVDSKGKPKQKYTKSDFTGPNKKSELIGYTPVTFFDNGVEKILIVENKLAEQLLDIKNTKLDRVLRKVGFFTGVNILRYMATVGNPLFIIGNVPIDIANAVFLTDVYSWFKPLALLQASAGFSRKIIRSIYDDIRTIFDNEYENKEYREYVEHGGAIDIFARDGLKTLREGLLSENALRRGTAKTLNTIGATMSYLGSKSEFAMRVAVYAKQKQNLINKFKKENKREPNKEELDAIMWSAAREGRELVDFSQGGSFIKTVDTMVPYLNPATQGVRKTLKYSKENPLGFANSMVQASLMAGSFAAYSLANAYSLYSNDDDDEKNRKVKDALDSISPHEKAMYHIIFTGRVDESGNLEYIKIKKLPVVGVLTTIVEQYSYKAFFEMNGGEYNVDTKLMWNVIKKSMPLWPTEIESRNPLVSAYITYKYNRDTFTGEEVFRSPKDKKIKAEHEGINDDRVEEFFKVLAPFFGMSPKRSKAALEKIITSPNTNPMVHVLYAAMNGAFGATSFVEDIKACGEMMVESATKKLVKFTNPDILQFQREDRYKEMETNIESEIWVKEQSVYNKIEKIYEEGKELSTAELVEIVKDKFPERDFEKYVEKYTTFIRNRNLDRGMLDVIYERVPESQAYKMYVEFGPVIGDSESEYISNIESASGKKISKKAWSIYQEKYQKK